MFSQNLEFSFPKVLLNFVACVLLPRWLLAACFQLGAKMSQEQELLMDEAVEHLAWIFQTV